MKTAAKNPLVRVLAIVGALVMVLTGLLTSTPPVYASSFKEDVSVSYQHESTESSGQVAKAEAEISAPKTGAPQSEAGFPSEDQLQSGGTDVGPAEPRGPTDLPAEGVVSTGPAGGRSISSFGIGTGGAGGGTGGGTGTQVSVINYDDLSDLPNPKQGWGAAASQQYFINMWRSSIPYSTYEADWTAGGWSWQQVNTACTAAVDQAVARTPGATTARVVSLAFSWSPGAGAHIAGQGNSTYRSDVQRLWTNSGFIGYSQARLDSVYNAHMSQIDSMGTSVRATCVALNDTEWPVGYTLGLTTDKQAAFSLSGGTQAVSDTITTTAPGFTGQTTVPGSVTLNFRGIAGATPAAKTISKPVSIKVGSDNVTSSPSFAPSDLGMTTWAPGKYWFNVSVPKSGEMTAAASHNGENDPRESWSAKFALGVTTRAQDSFSLAGGTESVRDQITTSAPGFTGQTTVDGKITLNWDGFPATDSVKKSSTKDVAIKVGSDNTTLSPTFAPADFGWSKWPAGRFWYDIEIPRQGDMIADVSTPDRIPAETWTADVSAPEKTLWDPQGTTDLGDKPNIASGQSILAKIKVFSGGADSMWMKDILEDGRVFLGGSDKDDVSKIYVEGPDGKRLPDSQVSISIKANGGANNARTVTAHVSPAAGKNMLDLGFYTLVVPTTPKASNGDYVFADSSQACFAGEEKQCVDGGSVDPGKVTPDPDKGWALDEDGALVVADPDWTNNQGADNQTFLPGDTVYATVNDNIFKKGTKAPLDLPLRFYSITDDWSDALKYIDFSDASKVKVWWKQTGASAYTNVTSQFDVAVDTAKGTTTAVAKTGSAFLAETGRPGKGGSVKLTIGGKFLDSINTGGSKEQMLNKGNVQWNNEKKATNEPPVFVWTPDPDKDVIGAPENGGGDESINGQTVFPGQVLKYQVKLDTTLPEGMAWDVTKFGMVDHYDPQFEPNKASVEVTGRDGVIAKSNYQVVWDETDPADPRFELLFKESWIKDYLLDYQYDSEGNPVVGQDGRRYLTVTFTGKVKDTVAPGDVVKNQALQLLNNSKTPTPIPEVTIPPTEPDKEDLKCSVNPDTGQYENCDDIDGKVVVKGDQIDYRLTMDARPAASKFAYLVHKLGMIDDFDEEYLSLSEDDVKVTVATVGSDAKDKFRAGQDVTDMFNIQVDQETGVAYVFAKTVDTPVANEDGVVIPGDPQPSDLAAYASAAINPLTDAAIDQDLLGNTYYVYLRTQVIKETDGYVIENQAQQNSNNMTTVTKVVSNPLKEINPGKDVTVDVDGESINHGEVPIKGVFNYLLKSSVIPADRAYESSQWYIVDDYNEEYDRYTGQWLIQAQTDIYDGDILVAEAGETIASGQLTEDTEDTEGTEEPSEPVEGEDESGGVVGTPEPPAQVPAFQDSFSVVDEDGVLTVTALKDSYLDTLNSRLDLEQGWKAYVQFERLRPGTVTNVLTEYYNDFPREPEEVVTETPENPAITLVKYDVESGLEKGDRNEVADALKIKTNKPIEVAFLATNTGDVPLTNLTLTDKTIAGSGTVKDITCEPKLEDLILDVGETFTCTGFLMDMDPESIHTNMGTVTGESIYTGEKVTDEDPWNAASAWGSGGAGGGLAHTGLGGFLIILVAGGALVGGGAVVMRRMRQANA